jgi:hypothetical protein
MIVDGTIVNADINAAAAIDGTKVAAATDTVRGTVEMATLAEVQAGVDTTRYPNPADLKATYNKKATYAVPTDVGGNRGWDPGFIPLASTSAVAITADTIYWEPFFVPDDMSLDLISVTMTAPAAAGKLLKLGVCAADSNMQPTGAMLADSGSLPADTAGSTLVSAVINAPLTRGWYLKALWSDGTPTFRMARGIPATQMPLNIGSGAVWWFTNFITNPQVYGAWPGVLPAWVASGASTTVGTNNFIHIRIAT